MIETLDTLAAAHAEAGQSPEAVEAASRAYSLAVAQNYPQAPDFGARLRLYQNGVPYHEPMPGESPGTR